MIARGAGRSYGDAAQNDGGDVLDMTGLDRIVSIDDEHGLITAQAGATVAQLMVRLAAHGLTLPVVPGDPACDARRARSRATFMARITTATAVLPATWRRSRCARPPAA